MGSSGGTTTSWTEDRPGSPRQAMRRWIWILALVGSVLAMAGAATVAQSFGEGGGFPGEPLFGPSGADQARTGSEPVLPSRTYFSHDQALKLALLLLFMVGGGVLALVGHPRWRKAYLIAAVGVLGLYMGGFLCPTAAVQNVFLKAGTAYLLLFLVPVVGALLMGRIFCGYVCPFGALQELLHVRRWSLRIPDRVLRALGWLRNGALVALVARVLVVHTTILEGFSPFKPLFVWGGTPVTIGFTVVVALLSVVVFRPFCGVLCPYGALLSLVSRVSLVRLRAGPSCRGCNLCTWACPAGAMRGGEVDTTECLLCGACAGACKPDALRLGLRWKRTKSEGSP